MKTPMAKPGDVEPRWYLVDAAEENLGRSAVKIARMLQGKHRPTYTPHTDTGDFIVVINAEKIQATGNKDEDKIYDWYTGYPGGRKTRTLAEMRERRPEAILRLAVRRMLPKTRMGRSMLKKLKIYAGPEHPHTAQNPEALNLETGRS
ncbi:MAG: 50S ribosomal protein L13 [Planctomycetota bacterium]